MSRSCCSSKGRLDGGLQTPLDGPAGHLHGPRRARPQCTPRRGSTRDGIVAKVVETLNREPAVRRQARYPFSPARNRRAARRCGGAARQAARILRRRRPRDRHRRAHARETRQAPVYVRHEIVHNKRVVDALRAKGARFVEELNEVPDGAVAIFSAHGVPKRIEDEAAARRLIVHDATCPLVTKVHNPGEALRRAGPERRS